MRSNLLSDFSLPLSDIANLIGAQEMLVAKKELSVLGITIDSNDVMPGDLFVALPGLKAHGAQYIDSAVANGAIAVLTDTAVEVNTQVPVLRVADPRLWVGVIADKFYRNPS